MVTRKRRTPTIAIFAEGPTYDDPSLNAFQTLWKTICTLLGVAREVRVIGFSKNHLVKMQDALEVQIAGAQPLHLLVAQHYSRTPFDRALIAFDASPPNQEVLPKGCMREEVDFVLRHFAQCSELPSSIRSAAAGLRVHYSTPADKRPASRAPGALEVVYMTPKFEALLACDENTLRRALLGYGVKSPKDWPSFAGNRDPDTQILTEAVACAAKAARETVRGTFKTNKHAWAEYILRSASANSRLFHHEIAVRVKRVAA